MVRFIFLNSFARLIGYSLQNRQIIFTLHDLKPKAANTSSTVVKWLSLLYNFIQQSLNSGSAQVQILIAACRGFAIVRISDNGPDWK